MKGTILLLSVFVLSLNCFTQEIVQKKSPHYFGLHAGSTSAYGLSYRFWPNKLGLEITTLPTFQKIQPINQKLVDSKISAGLSALFKLKQGKIVDLYTYLGGFYLFKKTHVAEYNPSNFQTIYTKIEQFDFNVGLGLGISVKFLEVMDLNLQLGYGMYKVTQPSKFFSNVASEAGLYYNF